MLKKTILIDKKRYNMKHIKPINELFGIGDKLRYTFNKDEDIAREILDEMNNTVLSPTKSVRSVPIIVDYSMGRDGYTYHISITTYNFNLSDYNICIEKKDDRGGNEWVLKIDDEKIKASDYIKKRIFNKCEEINSPKEDFRRAFRTKKRR